MRRTFRFLLSFLLFSFAAIPKEVAWHIIPHHYKSQADNNSLPRRATSILTGRNGFIYNYSGCYWNAPHHSPFPFFTFFPFLTSIYFSSSSLSYSTYFLYLPFLLLYFLFCSLIIISIFTIFESDYLSIFFFLFVILLRLHFHPLSSPLLLYYFSSSCYE